jgi:pimeloyl-ACP methyl ester carboxylesterase
MKIIMGDEKFASTILSTYIELPLDTSGHRNKIHVRSAGKRSTPQQPTVVIVCGLGSSCLSFTIVQHELAAKGIPSFTYDRLGIGRSSPITPVDGTETPQARNGEELAIELSEVLRIANLPPPYVLVPHSYGGVISWEYIAAHAEKVVGLVAVDANSARSCERPLNDKDLEVLAENIPEGEFLYRDIVGLSAANRLPTALWDEWSEHCAPPEPWLQGIGGEEAEGKGCMDSCKALHRHGLLERHPLTSCPVTVIKGNSANDIERMVDASEALGGGTEGCHDDLRKKLEGCSKLEEDQQRDHLLLTDVGTRRFIKAKKSGHWVHIVEPELVVDEVVRMNGEIVHVS